jgi:hypothetical protein
MAWGQKYEV